MISIPYMTFNRKMIWLDDESILGGAIIAYSRDSSLKLTGKDAASDWWIDPGDGRCELTGSDETTVILNSSEGVTLRLFIHEFLIEQNPELNFEIDSGNRASSVEVVFERHFDYSQSLEAPLRTLFKSNPEFGKSKIKIPLASILHSRGYKTRYMRVSLHLVIGQGAAGNIRFRAWSDMQPVLVSQLHQSYSIKKNKGIVPVNAVLVNEAGELTHDKDGIKMMASFNDKDYEMEEIADSGVFQAKLSLTTLGAHDITITSENGGKIYQSKTNVSLTDGEFVRHVIDEEGRHSGYSRSGKHLGFLSGSTILCDLIPAVGVGTEKEDMIVGIQEFLEKTKTTVGKTDTLLMTSLNEDEFNRWLNHRKESGYRMFLLSNWTPDILDAGGNVSPYGAELAMRIFEFCRENEIYLRVDITHDYFAMWGGEGFSYQPLPNLTQYKEAGFLDDFDNKEFIVKKNGREDFDADKYQSYMADKWCRPEVRKLIESYFRHFLLLFRDETSIMLLSPCGEGDRFLGSRLVNPLCDCIRKFDTNHLLCVDQSPDFIRQSHAALRPCSYYGQDVIIPVKEHINVILPVKEGHWRAGGFATFSGKYKSDIFMSVMGRFFGLNPNGIYVEGPCFSPCWDACWPEVFHPAEEVSRLQVRDFLWLSLINSIFLADNWNELLRADEHLMPTRVSQLIDWNHFKRRVPPVMLRIYPLEETDLETLISYEEAFSSRGLDYGYVWGKDPLPDSTDLFIQKDRQIPPYLLFDIIGDGFKKEFFEPDNMPERVKQAHHVRLRGKGYSASSLISKDLGQIIVYLRNTTNYICRAGENAQEGGWYRYACRRGGLKNSNFNLDIINLPEEEKCLRLYDLNEKSLLKEERITDEWHYSNDDTNHDFAVVITN